jgi:hypothetical protein
VERPPFPAIRWPTPEEARLHGYKTIKDWYVDYRRRTSRDSDQYKNETERKGEARPEIERFAAEFVELENDRRKGKKEDENEESEDEAEGGEQAEAVSAVSELHRSLGTAETGPSLASPYPFSDAEPLAWKRVENHSSVKKALGDALKTKWAEATTGPPCVMKEALERSDEQFRQELLLAQGQCR